MPISTIDSTGITAGGITPVSLSSTTQYYGFKNRIINGAMVIDQRNAGASGTAINAYTVDRWQYAATQASKGTWQQNAGSVTPPTGFTKYLGFTSSSAYSVLASDYFFFYQGIEGTNISDLGWGTASAATVTLSFWVRSSLTGTFGASLSNSGGSRTYPFTYTISSANTWEQKTITIAGDTTGTWLTTTGGGIYVQMSLGVGSTYSGTAGSWSSSNYLSATGATSVVGTNGATFYITGVQLEKGSTATTFDWRPYGTELQLCQRYYCKTFSMSVVPGNNVASEGAFMLGNISSGNYEPSVTWRYPVEMRAAPSITLYNPGSGTAGQWDAGGGVAGANARSLFIGTSSAVIDNTDITLAGGNGWRIQATASIEL